MDLIDMFADSTNLNDLVSSILPDEELGAILLKTQLTVNQFIADIGQHLRSNLVADSFMSYFDQASTETVKHFSILVHLHDKDTGKITSFVFLFMFVLVPGAYYAGLHFKGRS